MKLTKHARAEILILACLALGSCDQSPKTAAAFTDKQRDEIRDIAGEAVTADAVEAVLDDSKTIADLRDRLDDAEEKARTATEQGEALDGRVDEIEGKLNM
jgi:hypothetical protein